MFEITFFHTIQFAVVSEKVWRWRLLSSSDQVLRGSLRETGPEKCSSQEGKPCCHGNQCPRRWMVSNYGRVDGLLSFCNPAHYLPVFQSTDTFQHDSLYSLQSWEKDMKMAETSLQQQSLLTEENTPPIRGSNCSVAHGQVKMASINVHSFTFVDTKRMFTFLVTLWQNTLPENKKTSSKHPLPRDYGEWDKWVSLSLV